MFAVLLLLAALLIVQTSGVGSLKPAGAGAADESTSTQSSGFSPAATQYRYGGESPSPQPIGKRVSCEAQGESCSLVIR